jgi:4-hydroxybutyryl-CoA dehydratase/vinylacetyl-CoA-Delta-isomerase
MGLKTKEEYIESIRALKPTAYMFGQKITNVVDNPRIRAGIEATAATYELASMPENRDLMVTMSPLINEPVSRFTLPPSSVEDLVARVKVNRKIANYVGTCHQRCTGLDCLSSLAIVTYDIDQKYGTHYNKNFTEFLKYMQKNDLTGNSSCC